MLKGRWLTLFLILVMAGIAFAGGATVFGTVTNNAGGAGVAGYKVDLIEGYAGTNDNGGSNYAAGTPTFVSAPAVTTAIIGTGTAARLVDTTRTTRDGFYDGRSNKIVTIRVWQGANARDVITAKGYYGINSYSLGDTTAGAVEVTRNIQTSYKADAPDLPTVTKSGDTLTWNEGLRQFLVSFTLTANPGRAYSSENVSYTIRIRKKIGEDTYSPLRTHSGSPWGIVETDVTTPYYVGGQEYWVQAQASNAFGSTWGPETLISLPSGGAGAGPITYNLKKAEGGLGLNAIAALHTVPFNVDTATPSSVGTVGQLVAAINAKSGANNTAVTFGWLENGVADIKGWYITYDAAGTATYTPTGGVTTGPDTPLERGKVYQVSVTKNVDVTFNQ